MILSKKIVKPGEGNLLSQPDPYIIEEKGYYYIYASNSEGVACFKSNTLENFVFAGFVLQVPGQKNYWAPSVIKIEDKFYLYYSSIAEELNDDHDEKLRVAIADNPLGPFEYIEDILPPFSIDPHIVSFKDELYLFYSANDYEAKRQGTCIFLDKMINPYQVEGKPVVAVKPSLNEEIFACDRFEKGKHWHTIEGAFYFNINDYHYLMYSGGSYLDDSYFINYAYAIGDVDDLRKLNFQKYPNDSTYHTLLNKNSVMEGAGHNSLIKVANEYYIVYHARDLAVNILGTDTRTARIDKLTINKEKITLK